MTSLIDWGMCPFLLNCGHNGPRWSALPISLLNSGLLSDGTVWGRASEADMRAAAQLLLYLRQCLTANPLCQTSCRLDRICHPGALEDTYGSLRTEVQR